ncbi:MAG: CCA tRNA nucleotidyltransferase [Candidatus Cloacimonadales bacterium]|nr:CCA tRNA nucleotidyltransferase [Candidatus Cloacimonadales bacterium]
MHNSKVIDLIKKSITNSSFAGKTYVVGGFVRDLVMEIVSDDIDIVVELPEGGRKLADFLHEKKVASRPVIYDNFGTALAEINGYKVEFVMTRKESYRDKDRKPEVAGGTLAEDIFRRDFTINSLLLDVITGEIKDITGKGLSDIENGIIRSTSEPDIIFKEDPLRMLRAVRFASRFNFIIEENTQTGIRKNARMLQHISWERRRDEFTKMLAQRNPIPALKMLLDFGLLKYVVPELLEIVGLQQDKHHDLDAWEHSLKVVENIRPTLKLHLIALLHDVGKARVKSEAEYGIHFYKHEVVSSELAHKIMRRLKFSNDEIKEVEIVIRNHMRLKDAGTEAEKISDKAIRRLILQTGNVLDPLLELIHADNISHAKAYNLPMQIPKLKLRLEAIKEEMKKKSLPITGSDIMNFFKLKSGEDIGKLLDRATEIWLESPDKSRDEILIELHKGYSQNIVGKS